MAEAPRELFADADVSWNAKACAAVLWSVVRRDDPKPTWWETFAALAGRMGCSERQARRAHWAFVESGWAARERDGNRHVTRLLACKAGALPAGPFQRVTDSGVTAQGAGGDRPEGGRLPAQRSGGDRPGGRASLNNPKKLEKVEGKISPERIDELMGPLKAAMKARAESI